MASQSKMTKKSAEIAGFQVRQTNNPTGIGGLQFRVHDQWYDRFRRGLVESCTATSKRSRERCRFHPMKGSHLCYWHGGTGGDPRKRNPPSSKGNLMNREIKRSRVAAEAEVERRQALPADHLEAIHRDAHADLKIFIAGGLLHPADEGRLLLQLDALKRGELTPAAWREARRCLGLLPPPSVPVPKAEEVEVTIWRGRDGW
jgi:hypothetical protein